MSSSSDALDINTLFGVKGQIAVITGGGTGLGLNMAQALEANGAIVYILGRRIDTLEAASKTAKHGNIHPIPTDVTSKDSLLSAASTIRDRHGHVDLVVANSGTAGPDQRGLFQCSTPEEFSRLALEADGDDDSFTETFRVNTTGVFVTIAAFLPLLAKGNEKKGGDSSGSGSSSSSSQVVVVSSVGAYSRRPMLNYSYGATKAGVVHMAKQLSTRFADWRIRVNVIAPGLYPSEMTEGAIAKFDNKVFGIPEGRPGDAQDMGGAILMLASRAGAYLNGNILVTDGGRLGTLPSAY